MYTTAAFTLALIVTTAAQGFGGFLNSLNSGPSGGGTWAQVETCARQHADQCIDNCMNHVATIPQAQRSTLNQCMKQKKQVAFDNFDNCLSRAGANKNAGCTQLGSVRSASAQNLNSLRPLARKLHDECLKPCSDKISSDCRTSCSGKALSAAFSGGDKFEKCYTQIGNEQEGQFIGCLRAVNI